MPSKKTTAKKQNKPNKIKTLLTHPTCLKVFGIAFLCLIAWLIYLDAQVRFKFEGKRWALPAEVYARSLEIYNDKPLNLSNLQQELTLLNFRKTNQALSPGSYTIKGNQVELYTRKHQTAQGVQPAAHFRFSLQGDVVQSLQALDQSKLDLYNLPPLKIGGIYPRIKEQRELLPYQSFPPELITSLLLTEDRDFKHHFGLSPYSIIRAAWANMKAGRVVQGGSTLTQQLVKNFYLSRERTWSRKINEAFMSLMLEAHYPKQDILETYMNDVFLGQAGELAIHGFGAASWFYFGKEISQCKLHEFALLVALIKGPSYYNPRTHPKRALKRRNLVLSLLRDEEMISTEAFNRFTQKNLSLIDKPKLLSNRYPAFMDLVRRQLQSEYNDEDLRTEGLRIYTTLNPQIQEQLEQAVEYRMPLLEQKNASSEVQTAAIVTAVGTGEVLAILGDKHAQYKGFNRALDANRPIGSLIKPAIYLTALMQPEKYHLATTLNDQAFRIEFENGQIWEPQNFDHKDHGDVPLYRALANSYNLSSARLGLELGIEAVHATLKKLGVTKKLNPYPSLFLGSQALTPFEVSQLFQTIASNGFKIKQRAIREVTNSQGLSLSRYPFTIEQEIAPEAAYLLQHALQEVMQSGTGRSAYWQLPKALLVAGKTGTTNENRDSWFAGFSGDYLAVVWVGRDDNGPTKLTGSSGALRIWSDFIKRIPQYPISLDKPSELEYYWFDQVSGNRTNEQCKGAHQLPIWGSADHLDFHECNKGYSTVRGWLQSWF
mgnify:CR=1 FL=1